MNKLEGKLIRCVYPKIQQSMCMNLFNHAMKVKKIELIGKRTDANIFANFLSDGVIHVNDINRLGKEQWDADRTALVQSLATVMIGAIGYGVRHEDPNHRQMIKEMVADEAATKKALNLKGWVTGSRDFGKYKVFIAISTGGDGFVFDGNSKVRYFIWNFDTNEYKKVNRVF